MLMLGRRVTYLLHVTDFASFRIKFNNYKPSSPKCFKRKSVKQAELSGHFTKPGHNDFIYNATF